MRRPGFQSQFSDALVAQLAGSDPLGPAIAWARANLAKADVDSLARKAGLSVRTLHRRCLELLGTTPKKLLDKLRVVFLAPRRILNLQQSLPRFGQVGVGIDDPGAKEVVEGVRPPAEFEVRLGPGAVPGGDVRPQGDHP